MELPEHSCISCAYLIQSDHGTISRNLRKETLIDENDRWNNAGMNYQSLVCCKGQEDYSRLNTNGTVIYIRNVIIEPNYCKDWTIFQDISSQVREQRTFHKLVEISILVARKALALAFIGMVITFIITLLIWYLD